MNIGSLFSGYLGLDLAVEEFFDSSLAWVSDIDPGACKILAHRTDAPNLGDITTIDWAAAEPVDVVTAGWPCQPFSLAGKRKGVLDERALWPYVTRAIRILRPRFVVLENVAAIATAGELARAVGDLSALGYDTQWTCLRAANVGAPHGRARIFILATRGDSHNPGRLRSGSDRRGGVLASQSIRQEPSGVDGQADREYGSRSTASLASYARDLWGWSLPATSTDREDAGSVALVAYGQGRTQGTANRHPSISDGQASAGGCAAGVSRDAGCCPSEWQRFGEVGPSNEEYWSDNQSSDHDPECQGGCSECLATDTAEQRRRAEGRDNGLRAERLVSEPVADADSFGREWGRATRDRRNGPENRDLAAQHSDRVGWGEGWPEPTRLGGGSDAAERGAVPVADTEGDTWRISNRNYGVTAYPDQSGSETLSGRSGGGDTRRLQPLGDSNTDWRTYEPAIRRWESVLRRLAPPPTETSPKGSQRLSPRFVEWMMGLPEGWVTDVPGLNRNSQLKALGNGVVPQQALAALQLMASLEVAA